MWLPFRYALHQCPSANVAAIGKCCTSNDFGSTSPVSECKCGCHFGTHFTRVRVQMLLPSPTALHPCPSANVPAIGKCCTSNDFGSTSPVSECKCGCHFDTHLTSVRVQM